MATNSGSTFYRIPAVCLTSTGALIAAWDQRNGSSADLPNNIDVMFSRSTDGGLTWSTPAALAAHDGGSTSTTANGRGDACLTYNPTTGRVFCHYIRSPATIGLSNSDNSTTNGSATTLNCVYRYSDDAGVTWSAEVDITGSVKTSVMFGTSASSGHGFANASGVYVPYCYSDSGGVRHDFVMYSTNNGTTWTRSSIGGSAVDEHHIVQRSDGTFVSDARPTGTATNRLVSTVSGMAGTWSAPATVTALPDPQCNGDLIRVDPSNTGVQAAWLMAAGCASTATRSNLTVWLSRDNGSTWSSAWQAYAGGAAYSSMVRLADGTFLILWEDTDHSCLSATRFSTANFP